jgi:alkylation response protein AidB-like acyl-CoA dehydrogenase
LVHAPLAAAALVAPSLLSHAPAELQAAWLPRVADGTALVVLAHQERGQRYRLDAASTTATRHAHGWILDGLKHVVPAGDEADAFVVPARVGPHAVAPIGLFLVERARCHVRGYPTADGARAADVTLAASPAQPITDNDALPVLQQAADIGLAAACAEGVGAMEQLLAITVEYMNTRRQFGVPIASFQALRHRIADAKMQLELARSMSYYASLKLIAPSPQRRRAQSQAKVQLGRSMRYVGQHCVQLHGGIGVTDECSASHYFKRLTALEFVFGDTLHHLGEVSERMADTAGVFS